MCVNSRYIYNRYIRQTVLVDCGKCESCLQQKAAHRANRIRNNLKKGQICLFVTLTYSNLFVPYVFKKHLQYKFNTLDIYRNASVRKVRATANYDMKFSVIKEVSVIDSFECSNFWKETAKDFDYKTLNGLPQCVGVCYYKDLQDFYKRLRQNLTRKYHYEKKFTSFSCSEYGGYSYRPHFHLLIFIDRIDEQTFRRAIVESWPYADCGRTSRFIEIARDCASYVSSYVNGSSFVSSALAFPPFRPKHSYSKNFGLGVLGFDLHGILEKIKRGNMSYNSYKVVDGQRTLCSFPVPKYVVNRYFPIFKGFSRLSPDALYDVILNAHRYSEYKDEFELTDDDLRKFRVRQNNAYYYYYSQTGKSRCDFALDYCSAWRLFKSEVLKYSLLEVSKNIEWQAFYLNVSDLKFGLVHAPTLLELYDISLFQIDPNKTKKKLLQELTLKPLFYKLCKQKVVINQIMDYLNLDV